MCSEFHHRLQVGYIPIQSVTVVISCLSIYYEERIKGRIKACVTDFDPPNARNQTDS